jgi:pimeloyl-ACP methyl ester carboxylesterase
MGMATVVFVHCGFAGGWIWREVATRLRAAGHEVFTPTLTGLGERVHLAHPDIDLATHVQDILGVFACEALQDVVLVGSSSGSMVITGVAEHLPERVTHLFYLDTPVPHDGQSWFDLLTPPVAAPFLAAAQRHGDGWRIPPPGRTDPPRWSAHPLKSVTQPLAVRNPVAVAIPRTFIHCTNKPADWFYGLTPVIAQAAAQVRAHGWPVIELPTDHLPMLSQPQLLATVLCKQLGAASSPAQ